MKLTFLGATGTVTGSKYVVEHGGRRVDGAGCAQVLGVGRQDPIGIGHHRIGGDVQCLILGDRRQCGQNASRHPGPARRVMHLLAHAGRREGMDTH